MFFLVFFLQLHNQPEIHAYFSTEDLYPLPSLSIYPNPSNGFFTIDIPNGGEEVQILSLDGQLIQQLNAFPETEMQIDLSGLNGLYFVQVKTKTRVISNKISIHNN